MINCMRGFSIICILMAGYALFFPISAASQDLYADWVTVTPTEGQVGDNVTLQAHIGNNGPGTVFYIQVQWFLSDDSQITTDDMALGGIETFFNYLYKEDTVTITKEIVLPAFTDPAPPSYLGLIIDPAQGLSDDNRSNNAGSTAFTYTAPPPGFSDPAGDNYLDVTHIAVQATGGNLAVTITFREPPSSTVSGLMAIDLDQDPATGLVDSSLPGAEAIVGFLYQEFSKSLSLVTASGTIDLYTLSLNGNELFYTIPLSLLGNDSTLDTYWAIDHAVGPTTDFDRAPDVGAFAVDTDEVVIRRPGDTAINIHMDDPVFGVDEPDFPNVKRMQGRVVGDQLEIILTYDHQVENLGAYAENDGLFVWIDIDRDHSLCTGFKSTEEQPPAFGIDYELRLQIDPLAGTVCELLRDENGDNDPEIIPMGLPFNDLFMRLSGDQVICRIPLGYLGLGDGSGALAVSNLNTRDILTGIIDRVPDTGAWDLKTDSAFPGQACRSLPIHLDDPLDDSIGAFGLDNDELAGVDVCLGDKAFVFAIDYKSYLLSNDGATTIFLDTDRNTATGELINNIAQDTQLGVDWALQTYWDTDLLKQVTEIIRFQPAAVDVKNQLTAITLANRLYVTIPFDCIGSPAATRVDMILETASWGGGPILLENDDIPNHGVITVPTTRLAGDFDGDGDVDGCDLAEFTMQLIQQTNMIPPATFAVTFGQIE